jgi:hypothetical protein
VVPDVDPRALFRVLRFVAGLGVLDMRYTGSDDVRREMIATTRNTRLRVVCAVCGQKLIRVCVRVRVRVLLLLLLLYVGRGRDSCRR